MIELELPARSERARARIFLRLFSTADAHWMWYIFPQIEGLGLSAMSRRYAIKNPAEARAYLDHALLGLEGRSVDQIFGFPDDRKLRSCATLFAEVSPSGSVFHRLLEKYFPGERDGATLRQLASVKEEG